MYVIKKVNGDFMIISFIVSPIFFLNLNFKLFLLIFGFVMTLNFLIKIEFKTVNND